MSDEESLSIANSITNNQSSTSIPNRHQTNNHQQKQQDPINPADQEVPTFFVRALYDYQFEDTSSLCFTRGALIGVVERTESGWWYGLLDGECGWFPSNYVAVLSKKEAGAVLAANSATAANTDTSTADPARIHHRESSYDAPAYPSVADTSATGEPERSEDLRIPQITRAEQDFLSRTGERASEIPTFPPDPQGLALQSRGMVFPHNTEVSVMGGQELGRNLRIT